MSKNFYTNFKTPPKVKKYFNLDDENSVSVTKQSFAAECDINRIVDKFPVVDDTAVLDNMPMELFGNIVTPNEMTGAVEVVNLVNKQMMSLPAKLRDKFGNDPIKFLEFLEKPGSLDYLKKEGYINEQASNEPYLDGLSTFDKKSSKEEETTTESSVEPITK